jgi:thiosulfate/3-mercaptopyruvate sulfurtransferase
MLPTPEQFGRQVSQLGISNSDNLVIYDTYGIGPACRVYWTFKVFGHENVSVMDGGLGKWVRENRKVVSAVTDPVFEVFIRQDFLLLVQQCEYNATFNQKIVKTYEDIVSNITQKEYQVLDARPAGRFNGTDPEPRPNLPNGHIPNSISLPSSSVMDPNTFEMLPKEKLLELLKARNVDLSKPVINSCGSGVTASVLYFTLEYLGARDISVYDGSWTEYASKEGSVIEKKK